MYAVMISVLVLIALPVGWLLWTRARRAVRAARLLRTYHDPALVQRLLDHEFWVGQTEGQLRDSLGRPVDTDESVTKTRTRAVWKYGQRGKNRFGLRITLDDGVVTGWEDKR